jgi:tetratricopeptide (TPR) repeat protein
MKAGASRRYDVKLNSRTGAALLGAVICLAAPPLADPGAAQDPGAAEGTVCEAFWDMKYDQALDLANQVLQEKDAPVPEKVGAYRCQACTYVAQRKLLPAKESIEGMLTLDASARFSPDYSYPPAVIDLYHVVHDSLFPGTMDIHTIAVGDFEDNSIYTGKFKNHDFSKFQGALVHTISADLCQATHLKVVDRQRIEQIQKEIELGQSGFANPQSAVRAGELLGAQTFIFGQFMILSKDKVRIDARVVHTATGQIILTKEVTGDFSGDPEKFLALERELVVSLAGGIDQILSGAGDKADNEQQAERYFDEKATRIQKSDDYVESKFLVAEALEQEDHQDYSKARATWKKVLETDPANEVAPLRLRVLDTMQRG